MATKSIIDIQINDEQFQKFLELFREYEAKVKDSLDAWKGLDEAMGGMTSHFGKTADSAAMTASGLKDAGKAQKELHMQTGRSTGSMDKLAKSAKSVKDSLFGVGKFLLGLGGISLGGGLLGLFGLDRLANDAMNRQRESRGLGMSTGGPSAFRTEMQRYVDVNSLLSQTARIPYNAMIANFGNIMGLSASKLAHESNQQRALDIINQARKNWIRDRSNPMAESLPATQAAGRFGLDLDTLRRLGNTPEKELMRRESRISEDSRAMRITDRTAEEMSRLAIQLKRTGLVIETEFMKSAAKIAPQLIQFTQSFTKEIVKMMESGDLKMWLLRFGQAVKYAADGIIWIGDTLSSFSHPLKKTEEAGKDIGWWMNGRIFGSEPVKAYPPNASENKLIKALHKHTQSQIRQKPHKIIVEAPAGSRVSDSVNSAAH